MQSALWSLNHISLSLLGTGLPTQSEQIPLEFGDIMRYAGSIPHDEVHAVPQNGSS